ncbi:MAG: hypothetical protein J6V68_02215 [Clostridia bacterium]|nr:hypothetical protein [Clostridia bacterium]
MQAVIDIGSNSVRLLISNGETSEKFIKITKLAQGLALSGDLNETAIARTADAVHYFYDKAKNLNAKNIFVFATAAVRNAKNGKDFTDFVKKNYNIDIDVISGLQEARCGLDGVLKGRDGAIIDIGGASSEITVRKDGKTVYSYSLDLGGVKILDKCGQSLDKIYALCKKKVEEYGDIPLSEFYAIGGTATSIASIKLKLKVYDKNIVHLHKLSQDDVKKVIELLASKTVEERKSIDGLQPERADVILGASVFLDTIMDKIGVSEIFVSEDDNLDGYLYLKGVKNEQ